MEKKPPRYYYGWVIVAVSFLTLFIALSARFSFGVFYVAILDEYGWGRGETAAAFSIAMLVHALFSPVSGYLVDRFSPRRLFPLGAAFLTIGLVAAHHIKSIWHLYLYFGVIIAIGINSIGFGPHAAIVSRWFIRKRGFATGLTMAGVGLGNLVLVPLIGLMINAFGWRNAFLAIAAIIFCIIIPATAIFQRRSPEEMGQLPDGIDPGPEGGPSLSIKHTSETTRSPDSAGGWTFFGALSTPSFWWLVLVVFCHGFVTNMLVVHQVVHVVDAGYSRILAASLLGLVGLLSSAGGIFFGFLSDRVGRETGFTLAGCICFLGICQILFVRDTASTLLLYGFVTFYGLGNGAIGTIYASTMWDLFPGKALGRLMSTLSIGIFSLWMVAPRRRLSPNTRHPSSQAISGK
ncbi:MAG: MFS transporter [Deltaproteobacteria bacterium]|nr:MFS transporter [Deltaproteobacteria bacterium]